MSLSSCCGVKRGAKPKEPPYGVPPDPPPSPPGETDPKGDGTDKPNGRDSPTGERNYPRIIIPGFEDTVVEPFSDRTYQQWHTEMQRTGRLFEDPEFPASMRVLGPDQRANSRVVWLRPAEIVAKPKFIYRDARRFDLDQGELGDCWFISAAACLAVTNRKLFSRVVPLDQNFDDEGYCGIFRFYFWRYDKFVEVVVDDRLPTIGGKLLYAKNREEPREFWVSLLEKAYAKLYGGYANIDGGATNDALVDMTGGISEVIDMRKKQELPKDLYDILLCTSKMNSMLSCSIRGDSIREEALSNGLYKAHAYSITKIEKIRHQGKDFRLLRLRNPWGHGEWNGAWSDGSREWRMIPDDEKKKLKLVDRDEGEFWMCYEDWIACYDHLSMCHLYPDALTQEISRDMKRSPWHTVAFSSEWVAGLNAGGCGNPPNERLYWRNPQFRLQCNTGDDTNKDGKCTMIVSLLQKSRDRGFGTSIAYQIYRVRKNAIRRPEYENYKSHELTKVGWYHVYINLREVTGRHPVDPGTYVIIPSTFTPNMEGRFLLRVYTEKKADGGEVDDETLAVSDEEANDENEDPTVPGPTAEHANDEIEEIFRKNSENGQMDAMDLQHALNEIFAKEYSILDDFGLERSRTLLAMLDPEVVGTLSITEFRQIVRDIEKWHLAFSACDIDESGLVDTYELSALFRSIGFRISNKVLATIVKRYGGRKHKLNFQDFICLVAKVIAMYEVFKKRERLNTLKLSLEEWMAVTLAI